MISIIVTDQTTENFCKLVEEVGVARFNAIHHLEEVTNLCGSLCVIPLSTQRVQNSEAVSLQAV